MKHTPYIRQCTHTIGTQVQCLYLWCLFVIHRPKASVSPFFCCFSQKRRPALRRQICISCAPPISLSITLSALSRVIGVSYQKGASLMRHNQVCNECEYMRRESLNDTPSGATLYESIRACANTSACQFWRPPSLYDGQLRHWHHK
jgi:hypothetical protein